MDKLDSLNSWTHLFSLLKCDNRGKMSNDKKGGRNTLDYWTVGKVGQVGQVGHL